MVAESGFPERVVLFNDFSQALGGTSHLVQVLIRELRERDIPVTFITGDDGANFRRDDVELVPLFGKGLLDRSTIGALTVGLYNPRAYAATRDWIAANDTPGTVYHVHGWCKVLTPSIFSALRRVADRVVMHGHDSFNGCPNGAYYNYPRERDCPLVPLSGACLRTHCDRNSYPHKLWRSGREVSRRAQIGANGTAINRLFMIHPGQREKFTRAGWPAEKLVPVRNPVNPPVERRVEAERNAGVLFIGRISAEKGADLGAAAAAKAGVPITFVGNGAEIERVRKINPQASFLGHQDHAGVGRALARARMVVVPSRLAEPFGLASLEAVGAGVPVVVSNRALVGIEIGEAGFGLAVDTNDIDAFAAALTRLAGDDALVETMSRAGHAGFRQLCHSESSWADLLLRHYRAALDGVAPAPLGTG